MLLPGNVLCRNQCSPFLSKYQRVYNSPWICFDFGSYRWTNRCTICHSVADVYRYTHIHTIYTCYLLNDALQECIYMYMFVHVVSCVIYPPSCGAVSLESYTTRTKSAFRALSKPWPGGRRLPCHTKLNVSVYTTSSGTISLSCYKIIVSARTTFFMCCICEPTALQTTQL